MADQKPLLSASQKVGAPARMSDQWTQKEHEEYDRLRKHRTEQCKAAFAITLDKLRQSLMYVSLDDDAPASNQQAEKSFGNALISYHNQVFAAAGFIPWLARNYPDAGKPEIERFEAGDVRIFKEFVNLKLKDLVLREVIWLVAEQVRHAPQRINQLFYSFRIDPQNAAWYHPSETTMFDWFLKNKFTKNLQASIKDLKEPFVDVGKVKEGIDKFKAGELNFDDIDESGKYNSTKLQKTFFEAPNMSLFFVIFKYVAGQAQLKYWNLMILIFLKKFGTLNLNASHTFGKEKYKATRVFILLDFLLLSTLLLNEWVVRLLTTRHRWASMTHSLRLRLSLFLMFPFLAIGAAIIAVLTSSGSLASLEDWWTAVDTLTWGYVGARILIAASTEMLPYSPVISLKGRNVQACWSWKGLRTRYFARTGFILILTVASSVYEWFLIVPSIITLIESPYCGEREFFLIIDKYSTQQFVCMTSTFCLWFLTVLAVAIDNGLAFITVMALVGWIRGYKTQGISRSLVHLSNDELFKKLQNRFVTEEATEKVPDKDGITQLDNKLVDAPKRGLLADEKGLGSSINGSDQSKKLSPQTLTERSQALWKWAVTYWRQNDYISNKEADYLITSKTIDCTLLASPDAEKHISFFINSLDVEPTKNLAFEDIPPSTVLIPVYGEKLEFDWNPGAKYTPLHEFSHLIAKYTEEWLNFIERFQEKRKTVAPSSAAVSSAAVLAAPASTLLDASKLEELELAVTNWSDVQTEDPQVVAAVTEWLSMKDQYVLKTIKGATSYYFALVQLALAEGYILEEAQKKSKEKCQVILCVQIYQRRWGEIAKVLARWMRDLPCFQIVIDIDRTAGKLPAEMDEFVPAHVQFATALLEWDEGQKRVMYRHVLPREQPLRIADNKGSFVQGKSMNQVNGMTFAIGRFVQVLDSNQGAHATEYLKFPALLRQFRLHPQTGDVRYRIVGSREYIFTKNLGTVARCHAYQEWSFGTLVLRTYSDLGIRLHYGHPDVFHGPWAVHHSGLSKVNPDINTSEDVFAGMETMKCHENTKHVEHIQFLKGRETGLANMSAFDTKISQGNSGVLRSRDMYALMERLDYVTSFLLFQGLSGHFTTISLMMFSMRMYLIALLMVSLSGASLRALGNITYSTEWLFHAGLTTIIPLIVEFLVEYGPVLGLLRALFFLPVSTVIYLFQMQTKHAALMKGIVTGKATYIATGRGLSIYRSSLVELFKNYGASHFYPAMFTIALTLAYKSLSNDLGGGTLPLIMIYVLLISICIAPQLFNPSLIGNTLREASFDLMAFVVWVGKSQTRMYLSEQSSPKLLKEENSSVAFFLLQDLEGLATNWSELIRNFLWHMSLLVMWTAVPVFLLYPHMQVWVVIYVGIWCSSAVIYGLIFYLLNYYEQPMRIIFIYLAAAALIISYLVLYGSYGVLNFTTLYVPLMGAVKLLEALRGVLLDLAAASSLLRYKEKPSDTKKEQDEKKEKREIYRAFVVSVLNKFFFVNMGRVLLALAWALACFVVGVIMRPFIGNLFLFGNNAGSLNYTFLKNHRKTRAKKKRFGLIV